MNIEGWYDNGVQFDFPFASNTFAFEFPFCDAFDNWHACLKHTCLCISFLWKNTWTWKAGLRLLLSMRPHVAAAGVWGVSCVYQRQCVFRSVLVVGLVAKNIFWGVRDYLGQSLRIELFSYNHKFQNISNSVLFSFWISLVLGVIAKMVFFIRQHKEYSAHVDNVN